jgi:hypothetical protein
VMCDVNSILVGDDNQASYRNSFLCFWRNDGNSRIEDVNTLFALVLLARRLFRLGRATIHRQA